MKVFRIAAIPGDGIDKEVIPAGIQVLKVLGECEGSFQIQFETLPWGCDYYHEYGRMMADAVTTRMVLSPDTLDVLVATNLHADILSDLAAVLSGSLGIGATANLNPEKTYLSLFEPIHGSAFDIMGKGIANPIGTFWTAVLMLEHLGEKRTSANLMKAIETLTASGENLPKDLGGSGTTTQVADSVCDAIKKTYENA